MAPSGVQLHKQIFVRRIDVSRSLIPPVILIRPFLPFFRSPKQFHARLDARFELSLAYGTVVVEVEQPKRETHPPNRVRQLKRPQNDHKLSKINVPAPIRIDERKQAFEKDVLFELECIREFRFFNSTVAIRVRLLEEPIRLDEIAFRRRIELQVGREHLTDVLGIERDAGATSHDVHARSDQPTITVSS
jgi:hypothetical protein